MSWVVIWVIMQGSQWYDVNEECLAGNVCCGGCGGRCDNCVSAGQVQVGHVFMCLFAWPLHALCLVIFGYLDNAGAR